MQALTIELVRLAHAATTSPESRTAMASALRSALAVVEPVATGSRRDIAGALETLADDLIILGDRAEWIAATVRLMMPRPLTAEEQAH